MKDEDMLAQVRKWYDLSKDDRSQYDARWAKNLKIVKGIFSENVNPFSKVRKVEKMYYRKVWTIIWRLVAGVVATFLMDKDVFSVSGRGAEDVKKAKILSVMVNYRLDKLRNKSALNLQHIWAIIEMLTLGVSWSRLSWQYDVNSGIDRPVYKLFPAERVYADYTSPIVDTMKYLIFESYLTIEDMEGLGYENIEDAVATKIPDCVVRQARYTKVDKLFYFLEAKG